MEILSTLVDFTLGEQSISRACIYYQKVLVHAKKLDIPQTDIVIVTLNDVHNELLAIMEKLGITQFMIVPANSQNAGVAFSSETDYDIILALDSQTWKCQNSQKSGLSKELVNAGFIYKEKRWSNLVQYRQMWEKWYKGTLIDLAIRDIDEAFPAIQAHEVLCKISNSEKSLLKYCKQYCKQFAKTHKEYSVLKTLIYTEMSVRAGYPRFFDFDK